MAILMMWLAGPAEVEKVEDNTERPKTEVESPVIVERKDGKIIWQLRASEAKQQLDGRMHLLIPTLTLFTDSGVEINISSQQAWFEPLQRNIHFQDQVNVDYQTWKMTTETLIYDSTKDEIQVPDDFAVVGETISAKGNNMRLQRSSDQIKVDGGIWIQDSNPQWQGVK
ncbi:LPS export ABC transporter protein LptC [Mariprofundus ferrinatatus]|uniref:LPS export ABC transporter protein LptC n=1 Tax=Mariprofundus ferrinatatus TaxID=1921087 RepID=A0A2K8L474_9PROT|nr:LPS export ABC transporter periplasmic protein LptC [Mariprofundus ferrinatatus]ATX82125.1 LPS export ABC transporter protein LptC [Mariprofundus ferrinatatus]